MSVITQLRKALTTTGDGAALLPYSLDPMLNEELLRIQPLAQMIPVLQLESKVHEYTVRTSHPFAWFEGESTPANNKNGAYERKTVSAKIQRIWGSVTGFAQAMDERFVNALATELEGSLEGVSNLMEYGVLWGTANDVGFTGDAYQYSGIVPRIFRYASGNVINADGAKVALDHLDQVLAKATNFRGVAGDPKAWFMGVRMKQVVDGLQTKVQLPLTQVELADGKLVMAAYGRAPIIESDFVVPEGASAIEDFAGDGAAGGTLTDEATLHYRIASVTKYGEQEAVANVSVTLAAGENTVELTWTADPNALLYYIFRGTANNNHTLLDIIPALAYDSVGTVNGEIETYSDTGAKTPIAGIEPLESGEQNILFANLNERRGAAFMSKIDDMGRPVDNMWSFIELARTRDSFDYFLKSYLTLRMIYPALFGMVRRVKISS